MAKKNKIYTKTGDDGTTGLFGGSRVKKSDSRLEAYGTIDELNAQIGFIRSFKFKEPVPGLLVFIQEKLFTICAKLASDVKGKQHTDTLGCREADIKTLENAIDQFEQGLPEITRFILPGGGQASASCHVARTICRRAERRVIQLSDNTKVPENIIKFLNRLSDFLFVLARKAASDNNQKETYWISK